MNKDTRAEAKYRGSGSQAFANIARVHMVCGRLPDDFPGEAEFGLSVVDTNLVAQSNEALCFSIVNSDINMDSDGRKVLRIQWYGTHNIAANALTQRERAKPGPSAESRQEVTDALRDMFEQQDSWGADEAKAALKRSGINASEDTIAKARRELGITPRAIYKRTGGIDYWVWSSPPTRIQISDPTERRRG
jgi:hypothetical protein